MHIELDGPILSQIAAELGLCVGGVDDCSGGMMVGVVRYNNDKKVRARVLEGEGCDLMNLVDIDSGEVFRTSRQDQVQASHMAFSLNCESTFFTPYSLRGIARGGRDKRRGRAVSDPVWMIGTLLHYQYLQDSSIHNLPLPGP